VIVLYFCCLYQYIDELNPDEPKNLIHFCVMYPIADFLMIIVSFIMISQVKS
jgi:hypothetical protein